MIEQSIQYLFITLFILLIAMYLFIVFAAQRAARESTIPIPKPFENVMIGTFFLLLLGLLFTIIVKP